MKRYLLLLIGLKLVGMESAYKRVMIRVKTKFGVTISLAGPIKLLWFGFRFHDVVVNFHAKGTIISIQSVSVKSGLALLFSVRHKISSLSLTDLHINVQGGKQGERDYSSSNLSKIWLNRYVASVYGYLSTLVGFQQDMQKLCKLLIINKVIILLRDKKLIDVRYIEAYPSSKLNDLNGLLLENLVVNDGVARNLSIKEIKVTYQAFKHKATEIRFRTQLECCHLRAFADFLSVNAIWLKSASCSFNGGVSKEVFHLEKGSSIRIGDITAQVEMAYQKMNAKLSWEMLMAHCAVKDLLAIFPEFIFKPLNDIRASGEFSLKISYSCSLENLSEYTFIPELQVSEFELRTPESANLSYLNDSFIHRVIGVKECDKEIKLSSQNPNFVELEALSEKLIYVVVWCEDPTFFLHKGVEFPFFGYAFGVNLATKKFTSGVSTLTMQLARNLFLGHHKDLQRKIEEMVIALLMEQIYHIPKERLLEIYLNIIEWGPGIYGIKEAANFYFGKKPHEMNLTECLVLSYIIPRPKHFLSALCKQSKILTNNLQHHIRSKSNSMFKAGLIGQDELNSIVYKVRFAKGLGVDELDLLNES